VKKGDQVTPATATIGLRGNNTVEITGGLNEGDVVVLTSAASAGATTGSRTSTPAFGGGGAGGFGGAIPGGR
jgi:hypothetical protein